MESAGTPWCVLVWFRLVRWDDCRRVYADLDPHHPNARPTPSRTGPELGRALRYISHSFPAPDRTVISPGAITYPPQPAADAARAEGTILFAVGVGSGTGAATLLDIAGDEANIFDVDNFEELDSELSLVLPSRFPPFVVSGELLYRWRTTEELLFLPRGSVFIGLPGIFILELSSEAEVLNYSTSS